MRDLTQCEVAAMWLWGFEYSRQSLGAIEFYAGLDARRKSMCRDFVGRITEADPTPPEGGPDA
jgi:hypothetical protein